MSALVVLSLFNDHYIDKEEFLTPNAHWFSVSSVYDEDRNIYGFGVEEVEKLDGSIEEENVYIQLEYVDESEMEFVCIELGEDLQELDRVTHTLKFSC